MPADLDVVNAALVRLGEKTILQLSPPQSKAARIAAATFADHRDALLVEHPWNFALERRALVESATPPAFGFAHAYPLADDVLRVWSVEGELGDDWKVERHLSTRAILTDLVAPLQALVIVRVVDLNATTPAFRDALAVFCAYQWCEAITGTLAMKADLQDEYRKKVSAARSIDGQEGTPVDATIRGGWIDARFGGPNNSWWG